MEVFWSTWYYLMYMQTISLRQKNIYTELDLELLTFQQLREDHPIKQWNDFVNEGHNKTEILKLLVELWSSNEILTLEPDKFL